jgi:hypothetical protein
LQKYNRNSGKRAKIEELVKLKSKKTIGILEEI